jgi:hypothetical protein
MSLGSTENRLASDREVDVAADDEHVVAHDLRFETLRTERHR